MGSFLRMEVLVPWRFLLSREVYDGPLSSNGNSVGDVAQKTGARIDVDTSGPAALALGGVILTIYGTMWQKRTAGRHIVDRMFEANGCDPSRWATFSGTLSIVLPASTHSAVSSDRTRADVEVIHSRLRVRDAILDVGRYAVDLEGNAQQVISGVTRINTVLQDLADHSQLRNEDFSEKIVERPPSIQDVVGAARLAPAAGVATQAPHSHPKFAPSASRQPTVAPDLKPQAPKASPGNGEFVSAPQGKQLGVQLWKPGDWAVNTELWPSPCVKLPMLLPAAAIKHIFLPRCHFVEIAQRCSVQIDLGEVLPGGMQVVMLTGPMVGNALATMQIQWRMAQCHDISR